MRNTGAAFSFMSDMRWVLVAVSFAVMAAVTYILIRYGDKLRLVGRLGLTGVLGGAFSNFIDRAVFGYVADFFEFEFVRFAVFNIADIFITVGGIAFCLYYLFNRDIGNEFMLFGGRKAKLGDSGRKSGGRREDDRGQGRH
jgi:signal peptidase II